MPYTQAKVQQVLEQAFEDRRQELLVQLNRANRLAKQALASGDSVSLLYASEKISECRRLLGWDTAKTEEKYISALAEAIAKAEGK